VIASFRKTNGDLLLTQYLHMLTSVLTVLSIRLNATSWNVHKFTPDEMVKHTELQSLLHALYSSYRCVGFRTV
jgi:hypothetical protein